MALYSPPLRRITVNIVKATPGRETGRALLRQSIIEAQRLGHDSIGAKIVSREGLEAMRDVFGNPALTVEKKGDWGQEWGCTKAYLDYQIPQILPKQD